MAAMEIQIDYISKDITCKICDDVYTDARDLRCGHTFCLTCLQKKCPKECPECKEENIPEMDQLKELHTNGEKNNLVKIEMAKRVKNSYLNVKNKSHGRDNENQEKENWKHMGVICNHCNKKDFSGARYLCGVCPSYNLCEDCEGKPKEHKHEKTHLFLKVKKPVNKPIPEGPILTEKAIQLGEAMDFEKTHPCTVVNIEDTRHVSFGATCDRCKSYKGPIKGICYTCGNCQDYDLCGACQRRSDIIHDPSHVFIMMKHPMGKNIEDAFEAPLLKYNLYQ